MKDIKRLIETEFYTRVEEKDNLEARMIPVNYIKFNKSGDKYLLMMEGWMKASDFALVPYTAEMPNFKYNLN